MKPSVLGLLIAALAFVASTIYLSVQLQEERAQADKLAQVTRELNARIAQLEKARPEPGFVVSGAFGNRPSGSFSTSMAAPTAGGENADVPANVIEGMVVNPQPPSEAFVKMMRSQVRGNNRRVYADVGNALGLSKAEADKLIDLITDQETAGFAAAAAGGMDLAERQRLSGESRRNNKAEIADLIGAGKLQALAEYQETIPARQEVDMLSRQLEGSASGLDADQQKRMLEVLIEERKRVPEPRYSDGTRPEEYAKAQIAWQDDYSERVSAQARGILDSGQLAAYNEYQEWQKEIRSQVATLHPMPAGSASAVSMSFTSASPAVISGDSVMLVPDPALAEKPRKAK